MTDLTLNEAYAAVDTAIYNLCHTIDSLNQEPGWIPVEHVIIIGARRLDDPSAGEIVVLERDGGQPAYITDALLEGAFRKLEEGRDWESAETDSG